MVAPKKDKVNKGGPRQQCAKWAWGTSTPRSKDCCVSFHKGTCGTQTLHIQCRVPCNWKKEFGAHCKHKFERWGGACDGDSGALKKALYNAQCQDTILVMKPCTPLQDQSQEWNGKD
ncbi:midkine-like [Echinops telfairi]|uniref:Midkine-like n=1 Tax=Echinops telfairi TaxID=9371 RepID=A0AC55CSR0_ECHTE|nr:midkine-like [Echinops telfairi]